MVWIFCRCTGPNPPVCCKSPDYPLDELCIRVDIGVHTCIGQKEANEIEKILGNRILNSKRCDIFSPDLRPFSNKSNPNRHSDTHSDTQLDRQLEWHPTINWGSVVRTWPICLNKLIWMAGQQTLSKYIYIMTRFTISVAFYGSVFPLYSLHCTQLPVQPAERLSQWTVLCTFVHRLPLCSVTDSKCPQGRRTCVWEFDSLPRAIKLILRCFWKTHFTPVTVNYCTVLLSDRPLNRPWGQ